MAKRNFDDVIGLDDWQPESKRPNSESTSTIQDVDSPSSNRQNLVKVNPMLVGLLERKPIDKNQFFDNVLNYFDPTGGSDHQNIGSVEESGDPKFKPIDDDERSPKMILNPKALRRQNSSQNPTDDVPNSNQKVVENDQDESKKRGRPSNPPSKLEYPQALNLSCCVVDKLVSRFWTLRCVPWMEKDIATFLEAGRPTPEIPTLGLSVNLYDHHPWVTGCPGLGRLYCWPCLLFTYQMHKNQNSVWMKEGFCMIKMLGTSMTKHEMSIGHKESMSTMVRLELHGSSVPHLTNLENRKGNATRANSCPNGSAKPPINPSPHDGPKAPQNLQNSPEVISNQARISQNEPSLTSQNQDHFNDFHRDLTVTDINRETYSGSTISYPQDNVRTSTSRQNYVKLMDELKLKNFTLMPSAHRSHVQPTQATAKPAEEVKPVEIRLLQLQYCRKGVWRGRNEARERIIAAGRPTPDMPGLAQEVDGVILHFTMSYYNIYPWICGSAELNRLYCWPCLLFNNWNNNSAWNTVGFHSMANLNSAAKAHSVTQAHLETSLKMKAYERMNKGAVLDAALIAKHNATALQKKSILKYLIDAVYFKKKHQRNTKITEEDYHEFLRILSTYNLELKTHLDSKSPTYLKDFTPNLIAANSHETAKALKIFLQRQIAKEVDDSTFVSFILKSVKHNRVALILRYSQCTGKVVERFFKFLKIVFGQPEALLKKILAQVDCLGCAKKFVGISYDGGVLYPEQMEPFNSNLRQVFEAGFFFHYKDDSFKATLQQSLSHNKYCRSFIQMLGEFGSFLRGNPRVFSLVRRMAPSQQDEWDLKSGVIITVRNNYLQIMKLLDQIVNRVLAPTAWSNYVVSQCAKFSMFLGLMETRLLLVLLSKVFLLLHPLIEALQGEFDAKYWRSAAAEAVSSILKIKTRDFAPMYMAAKVLMEPSSEINLTPPDAQTRFIAIFNETLDWILAFIRARTKYADVWEHFDVSTAKVDTPVTRAAHNHAKFQLELKECFPFFDNVKLGSALIFTYSHELFKKKSTIEMLRLMTDWDFKSVMPEFYRFLLLIITVPTTSAHVSSPVSGKIVSYVAGKTELKSADAIFHVENNLLASARNENSFYDDVIKIIAELKGTEEFTEIKPSYTLKEKFKFSSSPTETL